DADPEWSERAARILAFQFRSDPSIKSMLPDPIKRLAYPLRLEATAALLTLKQRPESVVGGLVDLLQAASRPGLRSQAARILGAMGAEARHAIPALRRALDDKHPWVREAALLAILRLEPDRAAELTPAAIRVSNWQSGRPQELIQLLQTRADQVT